MININDIKNNIENLKKSLPSLEIDSIFLEQDRKIEKLFLSRKGLSKSCFGVHKVSWWREQIQLKVQKDKNLAKQ